MAEQRFSFKTALVFLWLVVVIGLLAMLSKPVHAYETVTINPDVVVHKSSDDTWVYYNTNDYYSYISGDGIDFMGFDFGLPAPYYADRDHVSLYFKFNIQIPNSYLNDNWAFYVAPVAEYVLRPSLQYGTPFNIGFPSLSPTVQSYRYTTSFTWLPDNTCSMTYLILKHNNGTETDFTISGVADLNLRYPGTEMRPIRFGIWNMSATAQSQILWKLYTHEFSFEIMDTQTYYMLDGKMDTIAGLLSQLVSSEGSASGQLAGISNQITGLQNMLSYYEGLQAQYESYMSDENFTDPELTEADLARATLADLINEVGSQEDAILGSLEPNWDVLPTGIDSQNLGTYFLPFFSNSIISALVVACLGIMIVFALI